MNYQHLFSKVLGGSKSIHFSRLSVDWSPASRRCFHRSDKASELLGAGFRKEIHNDKEIWGSCPRFFSGNQRGVLENAQTKGSFYLGNHQWIFQG